MNNLVNGGNALTDIGGADGDTAAHCYRKSAVNFVGSVHGWAPSGYYFAGKGSCYSTHNAAYGSLPTMRARDSSNNIQVSVVPPLPPQHSVRAQFRPSPTRPDLHHRFLSQPTPPSCFRCFRLPSALIGAMTFLNVSGLKW